MDPLDSYPAMMSAAQVSEFTGVSTDTLSGWRKAKRGPVYVKLGEGPNGTVRYPREKLREYVQGNTVAPVAAP